MIPTNSLQIWDLLVAAKEDLAYCQSILALPRSSAMNFDPSSNLDQFYMTVCNVCFHDGLLIVSSLLDGRDDRPVSFRNWEGCNDRERIEEIGRRFEASALKHVRDKIVAHQDASNSTILVLSGRRRGIVADRYVEMLGGFLKEMIQAFSDFEKTRGKNYHVEVSFDVSGALQEIGEVMVLAKPRLTRNPVI
jgi:hypothetical protein